MAGGAAVTGYSGTPLAKKLGVVPGSTLHLVAAPADYAELLGPVAAEVRFRAAAGASVDLAHVFATRRAALARTLAALRRRLRPQAVVWVSWPKRSARVASEVTEDTVRAVALPLGFVDVKVCAVSEVWSGLKLVVRRELR